MEFVAFKPQKIPLLRFTSPLFSRLNLNLFYFFFLQGAVGPLGPTGDRGNKGREVKKLYISSEQRLRAVWPVQ